MTKQTKHQYEYEIQISPEINPKKNPKYFIFFIIFALLASGVWYIVSNLDKNPELSPIRQAKRDSAIGRVITRKHKKENCEQYALIAKYSAYYPVLYRGIMVANDSIWLNINEVWKYGITCNGELKRYVGQIYYQDSNMI